MSLPTFDTARDEILGLFKASWDAETPAVNGGAVPRVEWQGVDAQTPPPVGAPWARVTVRHSNTTVHTLAPAGSRRFTRTGLVTVQIFTPTIDGGGLSLAEKLATIARKAYEGRGTASGIWFRNARIQEIGMDPAGWYQMNVLVEFRYDERR